MESGYPANVAGERDRALLRPRLKWTTVVGWTIAVFVLASVVALVLSAGNSPVLATNEFLEAYQRRDAPRIAALTWLPPSSPPAERQWEEIFSRRAEGPKLTHHREPLLTSVHGDTALVKMLVFVHERQPPAEREIQFFLRRVDGRWRVDVTRLVRDPFKQLPL